MPDIVINTSGDAERKLENNSKFLENGFLASASTSASDSDKSKGSPATAADNGADADGHLEGTLNSNASKEFSFGTTHPAALPTESLQNVPLEPSKITQDSNEGELVSNGMDDPLMPQASPTTMQSNEEPPSPSDDPDNSPEFTFGTTVPIQLPDFSQVPHPTDSASSALQQTPGHILVEARGNGRTTDDHSTHIPLPPVLEGKPSPPTTPPPSHPLPCSSNPEQIDMWQSSNISSMHVGSPLPANVCYTPAPMESPWSLQMHRSSVSLGPMIAVHAVVAQPNIAQYAIPDYDMETAPGEAPYGPYFSAQVPEDSDPVGAKFLAKKNNARYVRRLAALCCGVVLFIGAIMLVMFLLRW